MKGFEETHLIIRYFVYFLVAGVTSVLIFVRPGDSFDELRNSWGFLHMVSTLTMAMSLIDMTKSKFLENIETDQENNKSLAGVQFISLFFGIIIYMLTFGLIIFLVNFL